MSQTNSTSGHQNSPVPSLSGLPFDDFRQLIAQLPEGDQRALKLVQERNKALEKTGCLQGSLAGLCEWLAFWSGKSPAVSRPLVAVYAGNHQLSSSLYGEAAKDWTLQAVTNATAGGEAVNQVCAAHDIGLKIFDLALQYPVEDITKGAALDERGCAATIAFGMEALVGESDLLVVSDTGRGNQFSSLAMLAALWGDNKKGSAAKWVEAFAPDDSELASRLGEIIEACLSFHDKGLDDPLEVLRRLGGREHAAMLGAILAARVQHVPVILDGLASLAAASVLARMQVGGIDHCRIGDQSQNGAEMKAGKLLGIEPVTMFGSALTCGAGGALAASIARTAAKIHGETRIGETL